MREEKAARQLLGTHEAKQTHLPDWLISKSDDYLNSANKENNEEVCLLDIVC